MSTITRELRDYARDKVKSLEFSATQTAFAHLREELGKELELARIALASLEAEPVAWTDEQELRDVAKDGCGYLFTANPITPHADPRRVIKLYAAPPAPVLPELMTGFLALTKLGIKKSNYVQFVKGWNACRAAMLAAAEVGNTTTTGAIKK